MRMNSTVESRLSTASEQRMPRIPAFFLLSAEAWPLRVRLSAGMASWQRPCSARARACSVVRAVEGEAPELAFGCWAAEGSAARRIMAGRKGRKKQDNSWDIWLGSGGG